MESIPNLQICSNLSFLLSFSLDSNMVKTQNLIKLMVYLILVELRNFFLFNLVNSDLSHLLETTVYRIHYHTPYIQFAIHSKKCLDFHLTYCLFLLQIKVLMSWFMKVIVDHFHYAFCQFHNLIN